MAARLRKHHSDEIRLKIKTSQLVNMLQELALTGTDASGNEVTPQRLEAAKTLLKKTLPDLSAVEHSGEVVTRHAHELTDAELAAIATVGSSGAAETTRDSSELH